MKFRDDIDPATTWIVSDTHFGHDNIRDYCHRPLDHDQVMIAEWRATVPATDTVLHLGDLVYRGNAHFKHIVAPGLIAGRRLLIKGNHDHQRYSFYKSSGFQIVSPFAIRLRQTEDGLAVAESPGTWNWTVSFSHYPWSEQTEGRPMQGTDLRIHGHIHNNGYTRDGFVPFTRGHINMSVEQTKYRPVNLKLLLDSVLLGEYPETTEAQHQEVRDRKAGKR